MEQSKTKRENEKIRNWAGKTTKILLKTIKCFSQTYRKNLP